MKSPPNRSLPLYITTRLAASFAGQLIALALGWQMYELTGSTMYLGLVGLAQFVPMVLMTLFTGYVADHYNRKIIVLISELSLSFCYLMLGLTSYWGVVDKTTLLAAAFVIGAINAVNGPSMQAILPGIIEKDKFPRATAIAASCSQAATIIGPAAGGILYVFGASTVYFTAATAILIGCSTIMLVKIVKREPLKDPVSIKSLLAGITAACLRRHNPEDRTGGARLAARCSSRWRPACFLCSREKACP
jgi:MFS family permease